jgi:TRAM domain-containing protein
VHARVESGVRSQESGRRPEIGELVEVRVTKATAWSLQGEIAAAVGV